MEKVKDKAKLCLIKGGELHKKLLAVLKSRLFDLLEETEGDLQNPSSGDIDEFESRLKEMDEVVGFIGALVRSSGDLELNPAHTGKRKFSAQWLRDRFNVDEILESFSNEPKPSLDSEGFSKEEGSALAEYSRKAKQYLELSTFMIELKHAESVTFIANEPSRC